VAQYPQTEERTEYLMSPEELRRFLRVGRTLAYRLLSEGEIPSVRLGRLVRVRRSDVDRYVESRLEPVDD
jgi:excisionase family DNA binding protein